MRDISISSYGKCRGEGSGAHALLVSMGDVHLWFSYQTCVAFQVGRLFAISENVWGSTTGKHLNWIDPDEGNRMGRVAFEKLLESMVTGLEWKVAGLVDA